MSQSRPSEKDSVSLMNTSHHQSKLEETVHMLQHMRILSELLKNKLILQPSNTNSSSSSNKDALPSSSTTTTTTTTTSNRHKRQRDETHHLHQQEMHTRLLLESKSHKGMPLQSSILIPLLSKPDTHELIQTHPLVLIYYSFVQSLLYALLSIQDIPRSQLLKPLSVDAPLLLQHVHSIMSAMDQLISCYPTAISSGALYVAVEQEVTSVGLKQDPLDPHMIMHLLTLVIETMSSQFRFTCCTLCPMPSSAHYPITMETHTDTKWLTLQVPSPLMDHTASTAFQSLQALGPLSFHQNLPTTQVIPLEHLVMKRFHPVDKVPCLVPTCLQPGTCHATMKFTCHHAPRLLLILLDYSTSAQTPGLLQHMFTDPPLHSSTSSSESYYTLPASILTCIMTPQWQIQLPGSDAQSTRLYRISACIAYDTKDKKYACYSHQVKLIRLQESSVHVMEGLHMYSHDRPLLFLCEYKSDN